MSKQKIMQYITGSWDERIDGHETSYYVLKYFENDIVIGWNSPKTRKQYGDYLRDLILPRLNRMPLRDYTMSDIKCILAELGEVQMLGSANKAEIECYSDGSIGKFRTIIKRIFYVAAKHGICDDLEWKSEKPVQKKSYAEQKTEERTRLPKSLRVAVEKAVVKILLGNYLMAGVQMALLLMFAFGLRNSEALGAVYGNILCIEGCFFLATHSTPEDDTAFITIGGKTYNMYRLLPIPALVLPILQARRAYLEAEVAAGRITLNPAKGINSVDDFPIANCEDDWTVPCSSARLTRAGRAFLTEAKIEGELMIYLAEDMEENYSVLVYGEERDPTAYLLRRTFGEHLRDCHCSPAQAERCMGHVQTDQRNKSHDFVNDDDLEELTKILARRPLLNPQPEVPIINMAVATEDVVLEDVNEAILEFPRMDHDAEYTIELVSNENHVPPDAVLTPMGVKKSPEPYDVEYETHRRPTNNRERKGPPADVNVVQDYQRQYYPKKRKKK